MSLVVPTIAETIMLGYIVNQQTPSNQILHLYTNNYTPTKSTTLANLTEANPSTGYQTKTLVGATWAIAQIAGVTTATYPEVPFNFTAAITIVGYYITTLSGSLLWVEIFSNGPFTLPNGGGEIAVTPTITLD